MPVTDEKFERLEERVGKLEVKSAVDYERYDGLVKRLDKIDGHISRLVWLVATAIIGAFMTFVIRGGFNIP